MKKRKLSISAEVATGDSEGQIKRVKSQRESDIEPVSESKSHSPTAEASDGPDDKEPGMMYSRLLERSQGAESTLRIRFGR